MRVDATSITHSVDLILDWVDRGESRYVCVSNVHMCMESYEDNQFQQLVNNADLVVPDGKPLAVGINMLGIKDAKQVRGADLTRQLLKFANTRKLVVGFYGGTKEAVNSIVSLIERDYSSIKLGCSISPPFRDLTEKESNDFIKTINESDIQILFVGLGCPKQEKWMANHKGKITAVMIGVGAVFDFLSGTKKEAPLFLQNLGLEWLFRLVTEPNRLWYRYAKHNPRFIWYFLKQILGN